MGEHSLTVGAWCAMAARRQLVRIKDGPVAMLLYYPGGRSSGRGGHNPGRKARVILWHTKVLSIDPSALQPLSEDELAAVEDAWRAAHQRAVEARAVGNPLPEGYR